MALLDHGSTSELTRAEPKRPARTRWLAGIVVVALLAVVGLGLWVYVDHHRQSPSERAATTTARAWIKAANAHDFAAIQRLSTPDVTLVSSGGSALDAYTGKPWADFYQEIFGQGFRIETSGTMVVSTGPGVPMPGLVSVAARVRLIGTNDWGVMVFRFSKDASGALKVSAINWDATGGPVQPLP